MCSNIAPIRQSNASFDARCCERRACCLVPFALPGAGVTDIQPALDIWPAVEKQPAVENQPARDTQPAFDIYQMRASHHKVAERPARTKICVPDVIPFCVGVVLVGPMTFFLFLHVVLPMDEGLVHKTLTITAAYDAAKYLLDLWGQAWQCSMHHKFCRAYTTVAIAAGLFWNGLVMESMAMALDVLLVCENMTLWSPVGSVASLAAAPHRDGRITEVSPESRENAANSAAGNAYQEARVLEAGGTSSPPLLCPPCLPEGDNTNFRSCGLEARSHKDVLCSPCFPEGLVKAAPCRHGATPANLPEEGSDTDGSDAGGEVLEVTPLPHRGRPFTTEQDAAQLTCRALSKYMRRRPTMPPHPTDFDTPWEDVTSGVRLPVWHCAFLHCGWWGASEDSMKRHLDAHKQLFSECRDTGCCPKVYSNMDLYEEAIASIEREQFPLVGPSVDRRSIELLTETYNDSEVYQLICFCCGQSKTRTPGKHSEIERTKAGWLANLGLETLDANLGWEQWSETHGKTAPLVHYGPGKADGPPLAEWSCRLRVAGKEVVLLGCPEDWTCGSAAGHAQGDPNKGVLLCTDCEMPVCRSCQVQLATARKGKSNVPMALANDNWYGYVQSIIAHYDARWIECAAASICWTTLITYQMEQPHGHLMNESMQGPRGRTAARGNVFSFMMPWQDILQCLKWAEEGSTRVALPHDGAVLAVLVRVHIIGGSLDVTKHLRDVHLRVGVVRSMLEELIARGFPGYDRYEVADIRQQTSRAYGDDLHAEFVPNEVREEIERSRQQARGRRDGEPWDKNATPAEPPAQDAQSAFRAARPQEIVAERFSDAGLDANTAHAAALERFGALSVQTGSAMLSQWKAEYLCMSNPFTLALPVGGYDVPGAQRWRRGEDAAWVSLADLVRGLPRRVEGQFRRHWVFVPLLWNLYFHEQVHKSRSLALQGMPKAGLPMDDEEEDATAAAARCYQRLHTGTYTSASGKQLPIRGDTSKLLFAEGTTRKQQQLLRSMHFMGAAQPGTQEARRQMGHVGLGAAVNYGNGIFMTISPSERHSGLALRLSRYRRGDPLVDPLTAPGEAGWIGVDLPRLAPEDTKNFVELPEYDLRRLIHARDPLCVVDAFQVYVRVMLARLAGIRMCPQCPHCNKGENPCQNRFGSSAMPQGGIFGRADAIFSAIEAQKSEGALHLHFKLYVQRAHQHKTLQEIASMIKEGLLDPDMLKAFHCWISNETYPDVLRQEAAGDQVEQEWPKYEADAELGRIPAFLWGDPGSHVLSDGVDKGALLEDGAHWQESYDRAAQHRLERVQHHIHKRGPDGTRRPLPACIAPSKPDCCKHEFPMDNRLTQEPLVICPGIAKERGLRISGQRSMLGCILGRRNSQWLNGTARAFATIFGFNTDVSPNDRLPITAETHERVCGMSCVEVATVARIAQKAQRSQTLTNGYFSGYMVKAQPIGKYELKKCVDKMHMLRERIANRSPKDQAVAVTRRMLTDLEMKGVLREAQTSTNLCVNLRPGDTLFQECIRTFRTVSFPGGAFMQRLQVELDGVGGNLSLRVPPTRRPGLIARSGCAPKVDAYGFRGKDPRVRWLSPYEFDMYWGTEAVLPPCRDDGRGLSEWCEKGEDFYEARKHDYPPVRLIPGEHYCVKDFTGDDDIIAYPKGEGFEALKTFRHRWVMKRHNRPMVPTFVRSRLPRPGMPSEESAKLCSVYLRPWTLNKHDADYYVPHLLQLAQVPVLGKQLRKKTPAGEYSAKSNLYVASNALGQASQPTGALTDESACSWRAGWQWYVKGHVVSEHACRIITNLLTNTLGKSVPDGGSSEEEEDEAGTRESDHIKPLCPSIDTLHRILRDQHSPASGATSGSRARQEQARTIKRTRAMWEAEHVGGGETGAAVDTGGDKPTLKVSEYGKAARALGKQSANETPMPWSGQTEPKVCIYGGRPACTIQEWLHDLRREKIDVKLPAQVDSDELSCLDFPDEGAAQPCSISSTDCGFIQKWNAARKGQRLKRGDQLISVNGRPYMGEASAVAALAAGASTLAFKRPCPNEEQYAVLTHVAKRVEQEWFEERAGTMEASNEEPLFDLVHGLPGTGKSRVIAWIRELFIDVLGWTHGNQFVCLAFQNTMAANIGGSTIHHWAEIPICETDAQRRAAPRDIGAVFLRCQNLRWILVDEISMVAAELFAELERRTTQAARATGTYKVRPDKSTRPFGGFNMLLFGDWWQLRPVKQTPLFEQPRNAKSGSAHEGVQLMWAQDRNSLRRVWELTRPMRCDDPFYMGFLSECRSGALSRDSYFFIHGAPTESVGSYVPGEAAPRCGRTNCAWLQTDEWPRMFRDGAQWADMVALECTECHTERLARHRVVPSDADPRFRQQPFDAAPYIHPNNLPKYVALQLRAVEYARQRQLCVNWVTAQDRPLHQDDRALSEEALNKKRERWLGYHDQQTAGIMGLLPLVRGLPMRLTDSVNRGLGLYKHRRCTLINWTLHPDEPSEVEGAERNLQQQPLCLYLKFEFEPGVDIWQVADLEPGVYPLQPTKKDWFICEYTKVKAKRAGFQVVPDFSATSHMLQGATLLAAILDCLEAGHVSKLADMLAAYVGLSRAKLKETVLIVQAFSPGLFAHGPPPGPHILMRLLRGEVAADNVDAEFERLRSEAARGAAEKDVMRMHWQCQSCFLQGREYHTLAMADFGVRNPCEFVAHLLPQGAWSRCSCCKGAARATAVRTAVGASNRERQDAATATKHVCKQCGEEKMKADFWPADWRRKASRASSCKSCQTASPSERSAAPLASAEVHLCGKCGVEKRRGDYWDVDWCHRERNILCKACQPAEPCARGAGRGHLSDALRQRNEVLRAQAAARVWMCGLCRQEKQRDEFWPSHFHNRSVKGYVLGCRVCKPTPPQERRKKQS